MPEDSEEVPGQTRGWWVIWAKVPFGFHCVCITEPFHEPVDWQGWGLFDYPKLIKKPMDLGTVQVPFILRLHKF